MHEAHHFRRVTLIWLLASVIATPVVVLLAAPGMPPGNGSVESSGQVVDNTVLLGISTPVALAVIVYFVYVLIAFREREPAGAVLDGPAVRGDSGVQLWWVVVTSAIVLFLAAYGTVRVLSDGAGGGQGPNPIAVPAHSSPPLPVQVIAQQWQFTFRFPSYGGVETSHLELPANRLVALHVTSLDVIHSFWVYQLGVKADANPGIDNVAYVRTKKPLKFDIHCAELCGVYHGYMYDTGRVVSGPAFATWIGQQRTRSRSIQKSLPPYARKYFPDPQRRGG